ncbi:zinc finger, CCHC-type containing protein [Tanacetum coccineum]
MPELVEDATVEAIRIRANWENDDYICRGHSLSIVVGFSIDVIRMYESAKELSLQKDFRSEKRTTQCCGFGKVGLRGGPIQRPIVDAIAIIHETTALYTPQQNGVAERKNRALKEMVNSMLSFSESRDEIFNENHFSSMPRPKDIIPNLKNLQRDDHSEYVPRRLPESSLVE